MKKHIKTVSASILLVALFFGGEAYAASNATNVDTIPNTSLLVAPVNLNTATAQQIEGKVKGIGKKKAEAIVAYRTEHGAFKSFDELAYVKGLGESFVASHLEALKKAFTLS